ncbi:MAG: hypothetical protein ACJ763_04800 [Bdellovibrionia bacterium]
MSLFGPFPYTFVHGDRFAEAADLVFSTRNREPWTQTKLFKKIESIDENVVVIYAATHDVNPLFKLLSGLSGPKIVLISHNSDGRVRDRDFREGDADVNLLPPSVVRWFGQNVEVKHPLIECIPIGLERPCVDLHAKKLKKLKSVMLQTARPRSTRVYVNHVIRTNPVERKAAYDAFLDKDFALKHEGGLTFVQYLEQMRSSEFCVSPPGNGPDCHRTWECLYLGTVPIVKRSLLTEALYSDLPVLQVSDYQEVTENYLNSFLSQWKGVSIDPKRISAEYYWEKIGNAARQLDPNRKLRTEKMGPGFLLRKIFQD